MRSLLQMFFDDSSSDDDDFEFEVATILLTSIAMNEWPKHGGSVPRRKVVRRKLFDNNLTDDESTAMVVAAARKKPLRLRHASTDGSTLARRPRTRGGLVTRAGGMDGVPVMDLPAAEAPMTGRQKRKAFMQAKLKAKEVQDGEKSAEEEAGTEDEHELDPAGPATHREAKPNPKYLGPEWVR